MYISLYIYIYPSLSHDTWKNNIYLPRRSDRQKIPALPARFERFPRVPRGIRGLILPSKEGTHQHEEAVGLVIAALPGRFQLGNAGKS